MLVASSLFTVALLSTLANAAEEKIDGGALYASQCIHCHGPTGNGTDDVERPLAGDLSVAQLANLVQETMPEDDPGSLSHEEAVAVSSYIHQAFYSTIARERNKPARVELARLTVRQYRQAVTDLIGRFGKQGERDGERGLKAEYFEGRRRRRSTRSLSRVDAQVNFDFGTEPPVEELQDPHSFTIEWNGSVLAPETGAYEIVVRTEHAARLTLNGQTAIDAWVKSGDDTEYVATVFLIGGRSYPLELEFSKATQGVNNQKKKKEDIEPVPASIALLWQRPHGVMEPIPSRFLQTVWSPTSYACETPFPPDDRSYGWERGTSVSKEWDAATTQAAIETATYVSDSFSRLAGVRDNDSERREKALRFAGEFVAAAFRRPLDEAQTDAYVASHFEGDRPTEIALRRVVIMALKSPRFLFREVDDVGDDLDVAARLSFGLWDSIPDEELIRAANTKQLRTKEQIRRQAERMLDDPRAKHKLRRFLMTWVNSADAVDLESHLDHYPEFNATTMADLRTSLELFFDDVLWSETSDYRTLFTSQDLFVNQKLADLYDDVDANGSDFSQVTTQDERRAGILTHPFLMARFAHGTESSPIHRGVFLARGVLGQSLRPPPEAVTPLAPELHPDLTTRERVVMQTQSATCMTCHGIINPLGFTLENFDAVGRYREIDRGKLVDNTGSYVTRDGNSVSLNGARELADFLTSSDEAHEAFIEQLFHHLVQQPIRAFGSERLSELRESFEGENFHIRKLAIEIMVATTPVGRETNVVATRD